MRIVLDDGGGERELVVTVDDDRASVADLLAAAGVPPGRDGDGSGPMHVTVDGCPVPLDETLREAPIRDGATVRTRPSTDRLS